ncbi:hypothetical protein SKAU_G00092950 [Synaphobranchus kaupii]|uniref:Uncharacterized protein n=1 Tax=Synaphobranchus kaupii TaxID=118154 RepID=A0A9Q1FX79_SYNKA|nr:hypothetical protein SKAU_G00092950 [Synaphobranchus kaupii]
MVEEVCRQEQAVSKPEAHSGRLQDKPYTRPVHLRAQTGTEVSSSYVGEQTDNHQHPASPVKREFVHESVKQPKACTSKPEAGQLGAARDWKLLADLEQKLCFPSEIATTNLRPDLVLWSTSLCTVYIIELTVPWEDAVGEAYEGKRLKYAELAAGAEQHGWKAKVCPVEIGCRGFVGMSTTRLLKDIGIRGQAQRLAIKSLFGAAERISQWLWIKKRDNTWAPK